LLDGTTPEILSGDISGFVGGFVGIGELGSFLY
jgi:hypothetical protein